MNTAETLCPLLFAASMTGSTVWPRSPHWYFLNGQDNFLINAEIAYIASGSPLITERFSFSQGRLSVQFRHSDGISWCEVSDASDHGDA